MPTKRLSIFLFHIFLFLFLFSSIYAYEDSTISTKYGCTGIAKSQNFPVLNIATFNIGKGNEPTKAAAIANLFEKYDVDILGMQELYRYGDNYEYSLVDDIPVAFANKFPGKSFYYYSIRQASDHSLMIVSKFPIDSANQTEIAGGRNTIYTRIITPFGPLNFFDTHLQRKDNVQCDGLNQTIDFINNTSKTNDPSLLVGDFNLEKVQIQQSCGPKPPQNFNFNCTSSPCYQTGIDFLLPNILNGPEVLMVCANPDYLMDSHEFYVSSVKFGSSSYVSSIPFDINKDFNFNFNDISTLLTLIFK